METALDPDSRLIGYAGKDMLKDGLDEALPERARVCDYFSKFRKVRSLHGPTIDPIISFLKLGGMSTTEIAKDTMQALIEILKRQIASMEQEQLDVLLDKCYTYLTVPELAPIGIAVLERLTFVDTAVWSQIVQNGLDETPYADLPLSIKKRIWASEPSAFDYEIKKLLEKAPELQPPATVEELMGRGDRQRRRNEDSLLKELMRLVAGADDDLTAQVVERMVEAAGKEESPPKRLAIANLFHDFVLTLNTRNNTNLGVLKRMAKFLDSSVADGVIEEEVLADIYHTITQLDSRGPVTLLIASTYSRDYLADQLVSQLLNRRGPIGNGEDEQILKEAANHLREDPGIPHLTFLCLCNIRAAAVLAQGIIPTEEDVDLPFTRFFPLLINEMDSDNVKLEDSYFEANGNLPHRDFREMVQKGTLEKRVITSYCLQLFAHANMVALSRFRLVLDNAFRACDEREEPREAALSLLLIQKATEDMYAMQVIE